MQSRTDEAILWCEKARQHNPEQPVYRALLAAATPQGRDGTCRPQKLAEARSSPPMTLLEHRPFDGPNYIGVPENPRPIRKNIFCFALRRGLDAGRVRPSHML